MAVLSVFNLSKSYNIHQVFEGVTFSVNAGERVALVGPNGAGKSTLLRIIAGQEMPTSGSVIKARGARVVYVPQEAASALGDATRQPAPAGPEAAPAFSPDDTLYRSMLDAGGPLRAMQARLRDLESRMAHVEDYPDRWEQLMKEYEEVTHRFELAGGYEMDHRIEQVLSGLGFNRDQFDQPLNTLSGGQRTRAALARALIADPDILLLDEPTNHLDVEAIEWLEGFLLQWKGTLLVIAHDRRFLNRVTTRTLDMEFTRPRAFTWYSKGGELREGGEIQAFSRLQDYPAPYDRYLELKAERYDRLLEEYEAQQETISRTWDFIRRYKEGQKKRQAFGRLKRLRRQHNEGLLEPPAERAQMRMTLRAHVRSGRSVFEAEDLVIGYRAAAGGDVVVLARCPDLEIERGERVALIGPNGAGKTTLLKTIMGEVPPLAGHIEVGHNVRIGYYSQTHEGLNADHTVLEEVRSVRNMTEGAARDLLAKMLFTGDSVFKKVADLSGGERSRVALAKLMLTDANFLMLDEPTNHLDLDSQEVLTGVLSAYDGTILFVSHDRAFIDDLATQVWSLEGGRLMVWYGNYSDYVAEKARLQQLERQGAQVDGAGRHERGRSGAHIKADTREQSKTARRQERAAERQRQKLEKRRQEAEARVSELEARLNAISDALTAATQARDLDEIVRLGTEYTRLEAELDRAYDEWQQVEEQISGPAPDHLMAGPDTQS